MMAVTFGQRDRAAQDHSMGEVANSHIVYKRGEIEGKSTPKN
jgi:hypothetical protein